MRTEDIRNVGEAWELLQDDCKERSAGLTAEELVIGVAKLQGEALRIQAPLLQALPRAWT